MSIELFDQLFWEIAEHVKTKKERDNAINERNQVAVILSKRIEELADVKQALAVEQLIGQNRQEKIEILERQYGEVLDASYRQAQTLEAAHKLLDQMLHRSKPDASLLDRLRYLQEVWEGIQSISNARFREIGRLQFQIERLQEQQKEKETEFLTAFDEITNIAIKRTQELDGLEEERDNINTELLPALIAWIETGNITCRAIVEIWLMRRGLIKEFYFKNS